MTVEADDNLLELISTTVRRASLVIAHDRLLDPSTGLVYRVEAIDFDGVTVVGSADIVAVDVDCDTFTVFIAGHASLDLDGTCDELDVDIEGSGELDLEGPVVERARVSIAETGAVVVNATSELEVSIAGSADVVCLGDPATDINNQGTGDVRHVP